MIFPPLEARANLYRRLLNDTLLVRSQTPTGERGHSFVYAAANAVVRDRVDDEEVYGEVGAFQEQMRAALSLSGPASLIPVNGGAEAVTAAVDRMWSTGAFTTILFEGYIADSRREHSALFESLDEAFTRRGATVLRPDSAVADRWNSKPQFTAFMRSVHGEHATPPGSTVESGSASDAFEAVRRHASISGRVIIKAPGLGGQGNLIVETGEPNLEPRIRQFLSQQSGQVRVEAWYPWRHTLGCTFFSTEQGDVVPLEVCAQAVSKSSGGFLGGSSITGLTLEDRQSLQAMIEPFAARVTADGMRGFFGVDLILSDPRPELDECRLPDCNLAVRFVESNMRVNGQNQDRLFAALVAQCHGRDMDRIDHLKLGVFVPGSTSRADVVARVDESLGGVSRSFSSAWTPGALSHVVIECYGEQRAARNDFVLFVGEDVPNDTFAAAADRLKARGWVKD